MPHAISNIGPILFVRWRDEILVADVLAIEAEIKKRRARAGEELTILWIVSADVRLMSNEVRIAIGRAVQSTKHCFRSAHVVVEGTGFLNATYRSIFTPARTMNDAGLPVTLHDSVEAALDHVAQAYKVDLTALVKTAKFQGVIR
jgi:hypothetical protein